ncbi:unnamed protein product [Symbiodinium necroappetens]|uniref:EF-hand domain-containing protein n=1 Tax=Symbiodinium necroappetens TaxID=1628268 RepID=A0A812SEC4_9DINO|nr:unnamed protein product [Symbiodinium necroappetens]|mmetsp:Transcript_62641/g.149453  ORF Transcript_62641/g.149453 Transcript_62641/m.149453 type:complete len:611 (-) Transcript_62641:92-1924(-)
MALALPSTVRPASLHPGQSVPGSPHRKMQSSRTLPMLQVAGAQALKTLTGSSSAAASNHQLVRANQIHIHKQWSQGTQKDWLPRPDSLPAGHPLLYRSLQNWRADEGRQGSKQSRGSGSYPPTRMTSKASAARYSSKQSASAARYDSKQSVMTRTSQAASRSGSKHSLPAMGKTFSSAGAIAQTSNAFTVGVSMRDISSVDNFRGRSSSPPPARQEPEQGAGSVERTVSKSQRATELVHELRDMVNEDERRERGETKKWLGQDGSLPQSIRQLDYWTARDSFTLYDVKRTGHLDKKTFYNLLKGISRLQDNINEELSEAIFEEIDINKSGGIDEDEFLGWVFQTNNFRLNHLREKLVQLPQEQVQRIFRKIDKTGDGNLDRTEFWRFIETIGGIPQEASDDLHDFIDSDASGDINYDEFLNWVHPDRELKMLEQRGHADQQDYVKLAGDYVAPSKPLMETRPGKPVVLQFWVGRDYAFMAERMKIIMSQVFTDNQVEWEFKTDERIKGTCSRVVAKVGRGIELWNRDRMMAYREDPFLDQSGTKARQWLTEVLRSCLPDVESAANLHRARQLRKHRREDRQGSKDPRGRSKDRASSKHRMPSNGRMTSKT